VLGLGIPESLATAAIALLLWAGGRLRGPATAARSAEGASGRAYLDGVFGPAPPPAGVSREGSQ
jgi:hypothetical protein